MTKTQAIALIQSAGVRVWGLDVGKCRVYGTHGGYMVLTREGAPEGGWALKPASSGGYRQYDAIAELTTAAGIPVV